MNVVYINEEKSLSRDCLNDVHKRIKAEIISTLRDDEPIEFRLMTGSAGGYNQVLVATPSRFLISKAGNLAGLPLGSLTTSFYYEDVISIEARKSVWLGWIEVVTPAFPGGRLLSQFSTEDKSPQKLANCFPVRTNKEFKLFEPCINTLRERCGSIRNNRKESSVSSSNVDIASEISALAALYEQGVLTEEEFTSAKRKLLQ